MKSVPRRLLVLGGGAAGVELAQVVRRLGGEAVIIEGAERVLAREAAPLGEALGEALRQDGIELILGKRATAARREGDEYVLGFDDGPELRGDRLLVATGRRPRVAGIGLDTVGITADPHRGIPVDEHLRAGERLWAIGDVNGIWPLRAGIQLCPLGQPRPAAPGGTGGLRARPRRAAGCGPRLRRRRITCRAPLRQPEVITTAMRRPVSRRCSRRSPGRRQQH